jgi:hypothetical protein
MLHAGPAGYRPPLPQGVVCHLMLNELSISAEKRVVDRKICNNKFLLFIEEDS